MVILITGKADSGKTTLGNQLRILTHGLHLDSDQVRNIFPCGFSDQERENHIKRMGELASLFEFQNKIVIVSAILPRKRWRDRIRNKAQESCTIYLPYGTLWKNSVYEEPDNQEIDFYYDWQINDLICLWQSLSKQYRLRFK